jgi:hypothetical protein
MWGWQRRNAFAILEPCSATAPPQEQIMNLRMMIQ